MAIDLVKHINSNYNNVKVESIKKRRPLSSRAKAKIVAKDAHDMAVKIENPSYQINKADWIQEEEHQESYTVGLRYKNQSIPLSGKDTKIRVDTRLDGVTVLKRLAEDLEQGKLDELMNSLKERTRTKRFHMRPKSS